MGTHKQLKLGSPPPTGQNLREGSRVNRIGPALHIKVANEILNFGGNENEDFK